MAITSEKRVTQALTYLAQTDESAANAKALVEGLSEQRKSLKAMLMLESDRKTVGEREAEAYAHERYQQCIQEYQNSVADSEILKNKRLTEALIVEVWRTEQANRRSGNI